jgi:hypothetical protein
MLGQTCLQQTRSYYILPKAQPVQQEDGFPAQRDPLLKHQGLICPKSGTDQSCLLVLVMFLLYNL